MNNIRFLKEWLDTKGNKVNASTQTASNTTSKCTTSTSKAIKTSYKEEYENLYKHIQSLYSYSYKQEISDRFFIVHYSASDSKISVDDTEVFISYCPERLEDGRPPFYLEYELTTPSDHQIFYDYFMTYEEILDELLSLGVIKDKKVCESFSCTEAVRCSENMLPEEYPKKLYHATYRQFLKSIKANGLGKTRRKMWTDSKRGVVYLADDPETAVSYAEEAEWLDEIDDPDKYLDNIIVLEVDVSGLDKNKLFVDENVLLDEDEEACTYEYHGIIDFSLCKEINPSSSGFYEDFHLYENLWS